MKTFLLIIITAFICSFIVLLFWATKNYIRETNEEKRRLKNCQKSLTPTEKKS